MKLEIQIAKFKIEQSKVKIYKNKGVSHGNHIKSSIGFWI